MTVLLDVLTQRWKTCNKCALGKDARNHVLWSTVPDASDTVDILFIGEGPGHSEDVLGKAFIGPSGHLLRGTIRDSNPSQRIVGFTNLVACRPTSLEGKNRPPLSNEIISCSDRLIEVIHALKPKAIVSVGRLAQDWVPAMKHLPSNVPLLWIKHPAYILRCGLEGSEYKDFIKSVRGAFVVLEKVLNDTDL